ncbi:uncharacterized protein Bfra_007734 [Botrytis fragariae]|uniref:Uncharacterized protein n=1 Tax=Botrytis fragariae TaxID=1964551 RepID=A0A8H6APM3_9HELO|nr:uncharacterized protein Bfra_007734 [Botrytis fragariae]KAF5871221.1 hypothetical protein Bfra_007734 [Botrytis fragariae]
MSNDLNSIDPVNSPTVPQRSAAIVNLDGRWALYHETIYSSDIPETSYYLLELGTGITTKLPKSAKSASPGSTLTNFIWADKNTLICQAQENQTTHFFTLNGPPFTRRPASAGHVDTLMTILKAVYVVESSNHRKIYVVIAVSGIGAGTTSARSSVSEVDVLGNTLGPGGQMLRCLVFGCQGALPHINIESFSGDILETVNLKYVPFPTRMSMGPMNFDISKAGIALVAQTEEQSQVQHDDISDVYFIPFNQLPTPKKSKELIPIKVETTGITGSASVPVLSHVALSWLAFLKRNDNSTERGETFIFKVNINRTTYQPSSTQRISSPTEEMNSVLNPVNLAWAGPSQSMSEKRLFYWADSQMSIVEIPIPVRYLQSPLVCRRLVTDFDHGGSILGVDCLKKIRLQPGDPGLLISRALANGSTDFLIYNADTGDRSMVQRASIGEVMTEQNQDDSNKIGGKFWNLTEDGIIEDGATENRGEVSHESNDIEDGIIEDGIIEDKVIENRGEIINESNAPEDGIIENRQNFGNESEDESLEPPFPALENRGGQVDSPLYRHSAHMLIIRWIEARRRLGLEELSL